MIKDIDSGAIAPQFLLVLFFVSALALGAGVFLSAILHIEKRAIEHDTRREDMSRILESVVKDLRADPSPEVDSTDDPLWLWNGRIENGYTVSIRSLSSSLNPNFVRKNIFEKTALGNLFKAGRSADELQQYREDNGLFLADTSYQDFFEDDVFKKYFSGYGWANINLVDEFAVRSLALAVTGSEATAASVREKVRSLLSDQKTVDKAGLQAVLGADYEALFPFINAEPLLNVNFVDPFILKEILADPDYALESPGSKAEELLARRTNGGVNQDDILNILGIDKTNRLFYYFGCITWFWEIQIQGKNERCIAVVCRYPTQSLDNASKPVFKIIEERFEQ